MLRILTTDNIHISSLLPPHALTPIAQLLHRAPDLHAARQLQSIETARKLLQRRLRVRWPCCAAQERAAGACGGVDVELAGGAVGEAQGGDEGAAEGEEEGAGEHVCGFRGGNCGWRGGVRGGESIVWRWWFGVELYAKKCTCLVRFFDGVRRTSFKVVILFSI